jgi:hypothetical protein
MSKKHKTQEVESESESTVVELTHVALGVVHDETTGRWSLVKVRYNPKTLQAGEVSILETEEGSRESVNYKFKIAAVNEGLVS